MIESILSRPEIERLGWALVHFVWQGALAAMTLAIILFFMRRRSAESRYLIATIMLFLMACAPIATYFILPVQLQMNANARVVGRVFDPTPLRAPNGSSSDQTVLSKAPITAPVAPTIPIEITAPKPFQPAAPISVRAPIRLAERFEPYLPWFVAGWMIGVACLSLRLLGGMWRVRCLTRRATNPAAQPWRDRIDGLARRLRISRPVRLMESAIAAAPLTVGWIKPVVLLPASFLSGLAPEQIEALLAHELAHIRRHDYLINLIQTAIETLLFYHPAVWWVSRRMRVEREFACDDLAARTCGNTVTYARALVEMETLRAAPQPAMSAAASPLLTRVSRLLGRPIASGPDRSWLAGLLALAMIASAILLMHMGPASAARLAAKSDSQTVDENINAGAREIPNRDLYFRGGSEYVEIPDSPLLDIGDQFMIEGWIKVYKAQGETALVSKEVPWKSGYTLIVEGPGGGIGIRALNGNPEIIEGVRMRTESGDEQSKQTRRFALTFGIGDGAQFTNLTVRDVVPRDEKVHVAAVWNKGEASLWVNGKRVGRKKFESAAPARVPLRIGRASADLGRAFNGSIYSLRMWYRVPDDLAGQMRNFMNSDGYPDKTGLVADWDFLKKAHDNTIADRSSNHMNGKLVDVAKPAVENTATSAKADASKSLPLSPQGRELVDQLNSADPTIRAKAADQMWKSKNSAGVDALIAHLDDPDGQTKYFAAYALGKIRDPRAIEPLLQVALGKRPGSKHGAAQALAEFGDPGVAKILADHFDEIDEQTRIETLYMLTNHMQALALDQPWAGRFLLNLMKDKTKPLKIRAMAVEGMRLVHDKQSFAALEAMFKDEAQPRELRSAAAKSLGLLGSVGVDWLMGVAVENDPSLRPLAITGLNEATVRSGYPDGRYSLYWELYMQALRDETGGKVTEAELDAFARLKNFPPYAAEQSANPVIQAAAQSADKDANYEMQIHPIYQFVPKPYGVGEPKQDTAAWGEAVENARCRVRFEQWKKNRAINMPEKILGDDNPPVVKLDIQNKSARALMLLEAAMDIHLDIDGKQYKPAMALDEIWRTPFAPGIQRNGLSLVLDKRWTDDGAPLHWAPGKHTVRVAVVMHPSAERGLPPITLASNTIEITTLSAPRNQYTTDSLKYEAGFVPDKNIAFLGDEVMISFFVGNTGAKPIYMFVGGDGRGIRPTRFKINAVDINGNKVQDPYPDAEHMNFGGIGGTVTIQPGLGHSEQMPISKWCAFTKPGDYAVTCRTAPEIMGDEQKAMQFDFGRKSKRLEVVTTFTLTIKEPSSVGVRHIIETRRADSERYQQNTGMSTLRAPVFLKPLLEKARGGDKEAIKAIGGIETPDATEALIRLARLGLNSGKPAMTVTALGLVVPRLPNPMYYQKRADHPGAEPKMSAYEEPARQRVARTWKPEMAAGVRELARQLATQTDQQSLELAGRILWYIGTAEDMPAALVGYTHAIEATKTLPFETHQYFRPRGCAYVYQATIPYLRDHNGVISTNPSTSGEAAAYLMILRGKKDFRPADWPQQVERMLKSDIPYLRELVLDCLPEPAPEPVLARVPEFLTDPYIDLQIAACKMAKKHPRPECKAPLLKILTGGKEKYLLNFAAEAAPANGIPIDQVMGIWVSRLEPGDLGKEALIRLLLAAYDGSEQGTRELTAADISGLKAKWTEFIDKNRDKLRHGKKFKPSAPEFDAGLFPDGFSFYFDNKPWPQRTPPPLVAPSQRWQRPQREDHQKRLG